jgi:hypothetical protein
MSRHTDAGLENYPAFFVYKEKPVEYRLALLGG